MKLLIAFSPLVVLILFQEHISCYYLTKYASSGYYQDADFVIGGLFSLRLAFGQDFKAKFGSEDKLDTLDIVSL